MLHLLPSSKPSPPLPREVGDDRDSSDNTKTRPRPFHHLLGNSRIGRAYLSELAEIPVLSREEEKQIALRMEQGETQMLESLVQIASFRHGLARLLRSVEKGHLRLDSVLDADPDDDLAAARVRRILAHFEASGDVDLPAGQLRLDRREFETLLKKVDLDSVPLIREKVQQSAQIVQENQAELVRRHLWLAISIASRHWARGLDLFDRIQEGNLGLVQAAERFRVRRGFRFATYAAFWVRKAINQAAADQGYCVRLPEKTLSTASRAEQVRRLHDAKTGSCSEKQVAQSLGIPVERLREVLQGVNDPIPLHTAGDLIDSSPTPETIVKMMERQRVLREQLDTLEEREQRILYLRFGLDGEEECGREEVAKVFNLTRERIRQLETQAIQRLQHPSRAGILQAV